MSTAYRRRCLSQTERERRRCAERETAKQLLTSEGWQRWVRARSMFRRYSAHNCMLIALDLHLRGIEPEPVAGFRTWLKLGRCVRKGEHGIRIVARVTPKKTDPGAERPERDHAEEGDGRLVRFTSVAVFGLSQTDPLPGVEQLPLEAPCEPLTGDSHAHLLEPLGELATQLGYAVTFEEIPGATGGWCDSHAKRIVVDSDQAVNGQVRTLVHELVHALGVNYQTHSRPQAEVIVDTVTFIVCAGVGLDVGGESIPYVAGWGEDGALEAVTEFAGVIDTLAHKLEDVIAVDHVDVELATA
jgi:antirestriction factor ArdC-like protein